MNIDNCVPSVYNVGILITLERKIIMKKLIAVLTCLAMLLSMAAMLSACGGDDPTTAPTTTTPPTAHTHSFGTEWKSDTDNHWNECACGEKSNSAAHTDADVNGKCDVCSANVPIPSHEHSFGTEWVSDENNHWNVCECGEKANEAAHADAAWVIERLQGKTFEYPVYLDLEDPSKVIGMSKTPIIAPETPYECDEGYRTHVVFPGGMILEDDGEVKIYYGAADTVECLATAHVDDLIALCTEKR